MMTNPYSVLNEYNVFRTNPGGGFKRSKIVYAFPCIMCRKNLADLNNSASVVSRVLEFISSNLDGLRCQDQLGLGSCQKGLVVDIVGLSTFFLGLLRSEHVLREPRVWFGCGEERRCQSTKAESRLDTC